jgi:hypothetical protein
MPVSARSPLDFTRRIHIHRQTSTHDKKCSILILLFENERKPSPALSHFRIAEVRASRKEYITDVCVSLALPFEQLPPLFPPGAIGSRKAEGASALTTRRGEGRTEQD